MSNLLPEKTLNSVRKAHRARFMLVGSLVSIVCAGIALLALVPAYAIVSAGRSSAEEAADAEALSFSTDREEITRARALVKELLPLATSTAPLYTVLDEILSARPSGIVVTNVNVRRGDPGEIILNGTVRSRDEINAYRDALAKNSRFDSISVPVPLGLLTGIGGGAFSATLLGTF
jgi:hypothetical protein